MLNDLRILALIPARGGSKGIKKKNIIDLCGKPLIAYTIEAAKKSRYIDDVIISTDNEEIAKVGREFGAEVPFLRPSELAEDTSPTIDAVLHAVVSLKQRGCDYDVLVLLQPTSPLRTAKDIDGALEVFAENGNQGVVSVSPVQDHPLLIRRIESGKLKKLLPENSTCRRQDMPPFYRVNGSIYINSICELCESTGFNDNPIPYVMDGSHSLDVDEYQDLVLAEWHLNEEKRTQL